MTFYWYDIETFGKHPMLDRVAQFAGVRTDEHLNIIEDPLLIYCRITPDYVPDPLACLITGITPQLSASKKFCPPSGARLPPTKADWARR